MLNLVEQGPKLVVIRTSQQTMVFDYLERNFTSESMERLGIGVDTKKFHCVLCVADTDKDIDSVQYLGIEQPVESVLCHLMQSEIRSAISKIRALPPSIVFNSLGEQKPVVDKIQEELQCERTGLESMLYRENDEGVIVAFLMKETPGGRHFYDEILFVQQDYTSLLAYLHIHAPRYLAKAFAPDVWHMVDLRIYDRYEAYDLQYKRILEAVKALQLGYLVTETWNREVRNFTEPVGTYHIRLLTFLHPKKLKQLLIGLEYSRNGSRIVDLDLFWHGKKLSWKNLLDDKEIRRSIKKTASFFPKSNFFAIQDEKAALVEYCMKLVRNSLPEDADKQLQQYESAIEKQAIQCI